MDDKEKTLAYLVSVEKLAEEIISDRREIILLDKRRNENREALRAITKSSDKKYWMTIGCILVKDNETNAKELLKADQNQLDIDINRLRSDLKIKVNRLRDLEMQPPVPGLMLVPLSNDEAGALSSSGILPNY